MAFNQLLMEVRRGGQGITEGPFIYGVARSTPIADRIWRGLSDVEKGEYKAKHKAYKKSPEFVEQKFATLMRHQQDWHNCNAPPVADQFEESRRQWNSDPQGADVAAPIISPPTPASDDPQGTSPSPGVAAYGGVVQTRNVPINRPTLFPTGKTASEQVTSGLDEAVGSASKPPRVGFFSGAPPTSHSSADGTGKPPELSCQVGQIAPKLKAIQLKNQQQREELRKPNRIPKPARLAAHGATPMGENSAPTVSTPPPPQRAERYEVAVGDSPANLPPLGLCGIGRAQQMGRQTTSVTLGN